jgi:antitoxin ChpS
MHFATLRNVGGSVMFAIPKALLESLGLAPNTQVGLSLSNGRLIVEPKPRPHYTLAELMEKCDLSVPAGSEEQAWLEAEPVGREAL